jgi:hypothetical protein
MIRMKCITDGDGERSRKHEKASMFAPARDFLLETPWRIIIPNPNVNSHSLCY